MTNKVQQFIYGQSRNKLIIAGYFNGFVKSVDVGTMFSLRIEEFKEDKKLPLRAKEALENIFEINLSQSELLGRHLAIQNLGILLEPELKIDFLALLDKFSREYVLVVQWDGEIENDTLYFLTKEKGIKINIKNLSHIII